jgi:tetratricopeptide (TPR) repeat protein
VKNRLVAVVLCVIAVSATAAAAAPAVLPILGVDPLPQGLIVENHQDALAHWVERGLAGAVLLHIDADDGLRAVAGESLAELKGLASRRDFAGLAKAGRAGEGRRYDAGSFVRIAAGLGIVREVVWITPLTLRDVEDGEKLLKDYLGGASFSPQDRATFRLVDGCQRGRAGATPVSLCSQERLPAIHDPVLLSIDTTFFPHAAGRRGITLPTEARQLFLALRTARYAVLDAVFAFSVQEGDLPPDLRWVGDMAVQVLQNPAVVLADNPPERWGALQVLSAFDSSGQQEQMGMLGFALAHLEKQPHDPAFLLYAAEATDRHGGGERALAYAEEACRMDRGYCVGLREVGLRFLERGDVETGLSFFAAGEKLLPGMVYGRLDLAIALMKLGKAAEALAALEKVRESDGVFPSAFLVGAVQLSQGDRSAARRSFDAGLAWVERQTYLPVARQEVAQVIALAAAFYREEGLQPQAERLEKDTRLHLPAPQAGP